MGLKASLSRIKTVLSVTLAAQAHAHLLRRNPTVFNEIYSHKINYSSFSLDTIQFKYKTRIH